MISLYDDSNLRTITDLRAFLSSPAACAVTLTGTHAERAQWIYEHLVRFKYQTCQKPDKGTVICYLERVTGLQGTQLDRHIRAYKQGLKLCRPYTRQHFTRLYTKEDTALLAEVDNVTERLSGGLTIALMAAEHEAGDVRFARLKEISIAQLYRLRGTSSYREQALTVAKTKATNLPIGERRKPEPQGQPGFIRVDTVHQGDRDGKKGVYHINLVDEVTQWEVIVAVEEIAESFLLPVLQEAMGSFPFAIQNFHSDNGSEFINYQVATLLEKLRISQTKSRARKSTDNGLVESKNGSVIRKELGHWHIPGVFAPRINRFYAEHLVSYVNFHRPCYFSVHETLPDGKVLIHYPRDQIMTPYQKLISLAIWQTYLHTGVTAKTLQKQATAKTPLQAAREKKQAKGELLSIILKNLSATLPSAMTE